MNVRCFATANVFVPISVADGYSIKSEPDKAVITLQVSLEPGDQDAQWAELEKMLPPNEELIAAARRNRAPQRWYDEPIGPR